ncbi:SDR family NAD(P)-dependent oxidoreductase [Frankia gtarii]|uniref:SDR family NAD(P)-dependent oxidoreductase n=1 Tax=Frankia gtarii TaxID=2950102 RepID=UPI0021BF33E0|nr:SDR family NAD(P)-dependent oxidoreductase [Frankia gtarii]
MGTSLEGKVAVVTGAARGIGRGVAHRLGASGADVVVIDLDLAGGSSFGEAVGEKGVAGEIAALGRRSLAFEGDLADRAFVDRAFEQTVAALGRVDILVNNAGGAIVAMAQSAASTSDDEAYSAVFGANLQSAVHCSQAAVRHMRHQGDGGSIVNISSMAAQAGGPGGQLAFYGAAKAGLVSYGRCLATEVGRDGIRVNTVVCGIIATARILATASERGVGTPEQLARVPLRRFGTPEDVAKVVEFFVSDLSGYVTGQTLAVTGGQGGA